MNDDAIDIISDRLGQIQSLIVGKFTGVLTVQASLMQWSMLLDQGKIVWAIDKTLPQRFWQRQLLTHLPHFTLADLAEVAQSIPLEQEIQPEISWPYLALVQLQANDQIDRQKLGSLLADGAQDVIFDILQISHTEDLTYHHHRCDLPHTPPIIMHWEKLIITPQRNWQEWQASQLASIFPDQIPVIDYPTALYQQTNTNIYNSLKRVFAPPPDAQSLDHHYSLREVSVQHQQDLFLLARSLLPHFQQKTISLHPRLQDLPPPVIKSSSIVPIGSLVPARSASLSSSCLIAYIDDNVQANQHMAGIITGLGYQYLGIKDPSDAIDILQQSQPQPHLIIMEAAMPLINGRQICQQIRRSGNLATAPIILIVDQENLSERLLAKLSGAADIISHPLDPNAIKNLIQQYLNN